MNGCGCVFALVVLLAAFYFGPWAVLGWLLIVAVVIGVIGVFSD